MRKFATYLALAALAAFLAAPFVWMVLVSLHESRAPIPTPDKIVPPVARWDNYGLVLFRTELPVLRFALNSVAVTLAVVAGQLFVCSLAAFAMMFAGQVTQIPVFLMVRSFGWLDTYWALIVPGVGSAFGVFLLRQFFAQIPTELDEAARLDGAGHWTVYARVVMPMARAAMATLGAFAFIGTWTDFFWPLMATSSLDMRTLEVGLSIFKNSYGGTNWPLQMAAAVVVLVPVLAVFLALQRYFVRGVTLGGLK
jgi:multiple sugar transport system permease protein